MTGHGGIIVEIARGVVDVIESPAFGVASNK